MESTKKWALGFFAVGLILLGLFIITSTHESQNISNSSDLAVAEIFKGQAYILRSNAGIREPIRGRKWIRNLESVETAEDSDVVLDFSNNFRVRIKPQSLLTFEQATDSVKIFIKRGDISFENYGHEGSLFISKNGQVVDATDYGLNQEKASAQNTSGDRSGKVETSTRLTQKMIQDVLKNTRTNFYKCYSQLLQKTPGVNGQASVSFFILPTGKVSQPEVSSSTLADLSFKKCLVSVIERVEFPPFTGTAVNTVFPIRFE